MGTAQESTPQEILGPNTTETRAREVLERLRACGMVPYACSPGRGCNPWYLLFGLKILGVIYPMPQELCYIWSLSDSEYARFSDLWGEPIPDANDLEVVGGKAQFLGVEYFLKVE